MRVGRRGQGNTLAKAIKPTLGLREELCNGMHRSVSKAAADDWNTCQKGLFLLACVPHPSVFYLLADVWSSMLR